MNRTHGKTGTRLHSIWTAMRNRCNNPRNAHYREYGGRGIVVCERWGSFTDFAADVGEPPSRQHTLDREDNDGPYSPENCRWATKREQANNTRWNRRITYKGETHSLSDWSRKTGIGRECLNRRFMLYGHNTERLFAPVNPQGKRKFYASN